MVYWVSLKPGWKLQDVQAGLNVALAFLCAGGIFVLVRYCWLLAARRIGKNEHVPAYSLLSLNTIGETIDIIWLLRYDLFHRQYHGLLLQVVCVTLLTIAALMSGFIARFSTRYGTVIRDIEVNGSFANRNIRSIPYAEVDTNLTMTSLTQAKFPNDRLLEYLPNQEYVWEYVEAQWNSSWKMECTYVASTPINNPTSTSNCSYRLLTQLPFIADNWERFDLSDWTYDSTGWQNEGKVYRDWLMFAHGLRFDDWDEDFTYKMAIQTVAYHFTGLNATPADSSCTLGTGPIDSASYTSMYCDLSRDKAWVDKDRDNAISWGAYPEAYDLSWIAQAYMQHYGNRFRKESSSEQNVTIIDGPELATFYQAYLITKDTSLAPFKQRKISTHVRVAQVSVVTLIIASVAFGIVLFGLFHYWAFLIKNWHRLHATPQSKLDWMLQTLRNENEVGMSDRKHHRQRLSQSMANDSTKGESLPLNTLGKDSQTLFDRQSVRSNTSGSLAATPEIHDDGFDTPILGASFSPRRTPTSTWFPQQFERMPQARQNSWGMTNRNQDYNPVQQSPYMWSNQANVETSYDPGRR